MDYSTTTSVLCNQFSLAVDPTWKQAHLPDSLISLDSILEPLMHRRSQQGLSSKTVNVGTSVITPSSTSYLPENCDSSVAPEPPLTGFHYRSFQQQRYLNIHDKVFYDTSLSSIWLDLSWKDHHEAGHVSHAPLADTTAETVCNTKTFS